MVSVFAIQIDLRGEVNPRCARVDPRCFERLLKMVKRRRDPPERVFSGWMLLQECVHNNSVGLS